jgi:hypothetical protein
MSQNKGPDNAGAAIETFGGGLGMAVTNGGGLSVRNELAIVIRKARNHALNLARPAVVEPFAGSG